MIKLLMVNKCVCLQCGNNIIKEESKENKRMRYYSRSVSPITEITLTPTHKWLSNAAHNNHFRRLLFQIISINIRAVLFFPFKLFVGLDGNKRVEHTFYDFMIMGEHVPTKLLIRKGNL